MDHQLSIRTQTPERYVLGELSPQDREAFEAHFFECAECAREVRLAQEFADNAAAVFREEASTIAIASRARPRKDWFGWLRPPVLSLAGGCLAMAAVIGYQNALVIPPLRSAAREQIGPEVVPSMALAPSSRGVAPVLKVPVGARFFDLALDLGPQPHFERYACDLRSAAGRSIWQIPIVTLDPTAGLHLMAPANLAPGLYDAVLLGTGGGETTELAHYRFEIRRP